MGIIRTIYDLKTITDDQIRRHPDQVRAAIEKYGDKLDGATKGRLHKVIEGVEDKADGYVGHQEKKLTVAERVAKAIETTPAPASTPVQPPVADDPPSPAAHQSRNVDVWGDEDPNSAPKPKHVDVWE